jgi:hypothetical protein
MNRVATIFVVFALSLAAQQPGNNRKVNSDPDAVKVVTSDFENFWRAYALASLAADTERGRIYQREYLEKGSPGLQDFLRLRIQSAENLARVIEHRPQYYASLKQITPRVAEMEPAIRVSLHKLKDLYGNAVFPDVYFVIGVMNSGGTTGDSGLLIGTEMYGKTQETDMSAMDGWLKSVLGSPAQLPGIVAHELIHYQQRGRGASLLAVSIREGSADFVGEIISGQNINDHLHAYGDSHETELWREFSAAMNGNDVSQWLYQGDKAKDRPADLGYYMGYRIAQSYYNQAADKRKAIPDILTVQDYPSFLAASRYAP